MKLVQQPEGSGSGSVMVFAPALILTVTLEAGFQEHAELHLHAGGQGFWIARMIRRLEVPVKLCAPIGGETGRVLRPLIESEAVDLEAADVAAANGSYLHDRRTGERVVIATIPAQRLARHEADDLYNIALVAGLEAKFCVLTGQPPEPLVPPDYYRRLCIDLRKNGCTVIADLSGAVLESALQGGLDILKVSSEEAVRDGLAADTDPESILALIERFVQAGACNVVVSRAGEIALASVAGRLLKISFPRIEPVDFRGAGDSMTAGLAAALVRGIPLEEALRLAVAAGTLNVSRHGLGTGNRGDIERLARFVSISEIVDVSDLSQ